MIGCFPDPYPDELLYSVCARFCERMHISGETANLGLFGVKCSPTTIDLPCRLSYLIAHLPPNKTHTADSLIDDHSNFPFYSPFLPVERIRLIREDMKSPDGPTIYNRTGVNTGRIISLNWLRFCPSCINDDRKQFGECYWHRIHQLPGILICPKHIVYLEDIRENTNNRLNRWSYISAEQVVRPSYPKPVDLGDSSQLNLLRISVDAAWLLKQRNLFPGIEALKNCYLIILTEKGLAHDRRWVRARKLLNVVREQFPSSLLRLLNCDFNEQEDKPWPAKLISYIKYKRTHHPLMHLVLIHSIGFTAQTFFQICSRSKVQKTQSKLNPFGSGPWPCLNPTCDRYNELCIETGSISESWDKTGTLVGTFTCECGFQYAKKNSDNTTKSINKYAWVQTYGRVWEESLKTLWGDSSITVTDIARRLGISFDATKNHAFRLGLEFPRLGPRKKPVKANLGFKKRYDAIAKKLELRREEWLNIIRHNPQFSRTNLQSQYPFRRLYRWLKHNDHEWLRKHLPPTRVNPKLYKNIEWRKLDSLLSKKVQRSAMKLTSVTQKLIRVTVPAIAKDIGYSALFTHISTYADKLPLTSRVLAESVESQVDYYIRRVQWAANSFRSANRIPTKTMMWRKSGLKWASLSNPEVKNAIDLALQSFQQFKQVDIASAA